MIELAADRSAIRAYETFDRGGAEPLHDKDYAVRCCQGAIRSRRHIPAAFIDGVVGIVRLTSDGARMDRGRGHQRRRARQQNHSACRPVLRHPTRHRPQAPMNFIITADIIGGSRQQRSQPPRQGESPDADGNLDESQYSDFIYTGNEGTSHACDTRTSAQIIARSARRANSPMKSIHHQQRGQVRTASGAVFFRCSNFTALARLSRYSSDESQHSASNPADGTCDIGTQQLAGCTTR